MAANLPQSYVKRPLIRSYDLFSGVTIGRGAPEDRAISFSLSLSSVRSSNRFLSFQQSDSRISPMSFEAVIFTDVMKICHIYFCSKQGARGGSGGAF